MPFASAAEGRSLAYDDAYFQYIDFFAFLKDVMTGKQSVAYSFSNYLGQGSFALFTYYLSSPFDLIMLFLNKEQILIYFDLIIVLKLSLSALTFSWFLSGRFRDRLPVVFNICLSVGYAMMQFDLHQCYNVFYLDGIYMLPLMMLGVYYCVNENRTVYLSVTTALSILFCWYNGCINCVFSLFYLTFEIALSPDMKSGAEKVSSPDGELWKSLKAGTGSPDTRSGAVIKKLKNYVLAMAPGVLISMVVLIPTYYELRLGKGDSFDLSFFRFQLRGNPLDLIRNYYLTSGQTWSGMTNTVFCGCLTLVAVIGVFSIKKERIPLREKLVYLYMIVMMALMIYFKPFYILLSLLKEGTGHTGRSLYLGCFILLFLAAVFLSNTDASRPAILIPSVIVYLGLFIYLTRGVDAGNANAYRYTCIGIIVSLILITAYKVITDRYTSENGITSDTGTATDTGAVTVRYITLITIALLVCVCAEAVYNGRSVIGIYAAYNETEFERYEREGQALINDLKEYDPSFYRINQTGNRDMDYNKTTANYNEPLAFGYASVGVYTSTPHASQLDFLEKAGYRNERRTPTVVHNSPFISLDSILGVKYVLSAYEIPGMEKVDEIESRDDMDVYLNPSALPVALRIKSPVAAAGSDDPFSYNEAMLSALTHSDVKIFEKVPFKITHTVKDEHNNISFEIDNPGGNRVLYGYVPWIKRNYDADINMNDRIHMAYSNWNSPTLFYIPAEEGEDKAVVTVTEDSDSNVDEEAAVFYALDLDELLKVTAPLRDAAANETDISDGKVRIAADAGKDEYLFTTIPYDAGWTVRNNGRKITPVIWEDCMMIIPLEEGHNEITMDYRIPALAAGMAVSAVGIILLAGIFWGRRR